MARGTIKMAGLIFLLAFGIFLGVDLSTRGIERINGPVMAMSQAEVTKAVHPELIVSEHRATQDKPQLVKPQVRETVLNHATDKFGELLQLLANHLIRLIVWSFDVIFH